MTSDKVGCARLLIQKFSLLLASSAALFCGIAACGSQTETITWKEEVALHDGKTIVITRSVTVGGGRKEPGTQSVGESNYTLDFTAPNGQQVHWENQAHLLAMILDFQNGVPFLAAKPRTGTDNARYGCSDPNYVFYKYINGWQRIKYGDFPADFRTSNLIISVSRHGRQLQNRTASPDEILEANSTLDRYYREVDPNERSPAECKTMRIFD